MARALTAPDSQDLKCVLLHSAAWKGRTFRGWKGRILVKRHLLDAHVHMLIHMHIQAPQNWSR